MIEKQANKNQIENEIDINLDETIENIQ